MSKKKKKTKTNQPETKVLVIEDDVTLLETLEYNLSNEGYTVFTAQDGLTGLESARREKPDLIILDLMLPGIDGFEICRNLRRESNVPILMLTARASEVDKVVGLEVGADDYLTKPFSMRELMARIKSQLRRIRLIREELAGEQMTPWTNQLVFEGLSINLDRREVIVRDDVLRLKPKEFDLLVLLSSNPGKTYTRMQLLNRIWGYDFEGFEHTVNSHINRLRSKIEKDANRPEFILTTWG
ncbi:MAG: response regulator transcription factor, partial [Anaerolineae bacterium]|nr:response regulator transcription factor [Anaerolineae bacterium]